MFVWIVLNSSKNNIFSSVQLIKFVINSLLPTALDLLVWKQRHTRYMRDIDQKVRKIENFERTREKQPKIDPNTAYIAYSMAKYMFASHDNSVLSADEANFLNAVNKMKLTTNDDGQSELIKCVKYIKLVTRRIVIVLNLYFTPFFFISVHCKNGHCALRLKASGISVSFSNAQWEK